MIAIDNFGMIICIGISLILCSLLYFYLNKKIMMLEESLLNQARLLQNFISNTMSNQYMANLQSRNGGEMVQASENNMVSEDSRINISDDEEESGDQESGEEESGDEESGDKESGDEESGEEESGDEESSDEEKSNKEVELSVHLLDSGENKEPYELNNTNDVKLVEMNNLENFEIEELKLDGLDENDDSNSSEDDDEESESETEDENQVDNSVDLETIEAPHIELIKKDDDKPNFKKMSLNDLKSYAEERNLIEKGKKITKKNLLTLLEA